MRERPGVVRACAENQTATIPLQFSCAFFRRFTENTLFGNDTVERDEMGSGEVVRVDGKGYDGLK